MLELHRYLCSVDNASLILEILFFSKKTIIDIYKLLQSHILLFYVQIQVQVDWV